MDRISKKDQPNSSSHQNALTQPLKLKESLKIRDGLGGLDTRPAQWPHFKAIRLISPDLAYWVSDN